MSNYDQINILVVDDSKETLKMMKRLLNLPEWNVVCAGSGDEAIAALSGNSFALILMDVLMPGKNGIETAGIIRQNDRYREIPIVFITSMDRNMDYEFMGYDTGAVDFLYRPVSPKILRSKVKIFAELYRREKCLEETSRQLSQAQKMEAVGTLAGGIAHDFNNILAAIMGYIELARFDIPKESPARNSLDQVLKASHRAKRLVGQILSFSRQSANEKKPVLLQNIVRESMDLLRATLPSTIELNQSIAPNLKSTLADPTQIHQILMNLGTNAYHALGDSGGTIGVFLSNVEISGPDKSGSFVLKHGEYLKLVVEDNGCGMDRLTAARIFDPYFTTKKQGEGTGMGLSVVHGIVKTHGGEIEVESESGKGSRFTLYFPVSEVNGEGKTEKKGVPPQGNETILFVDDEEALAELGAKMLNRLGYTVVSETSSINALKLFLKTPDRFDLVITDMTMPDMTGTQLAKNINAVSPQTPIILCTGYNKQIDSNKVSQFGIDYLLLKPLEISRLAGVIREAADNRLKVREYSHG